MPPIRFALCLPIRKSRPWNWPGKRWKRYGQRLIRSQSPQEQVQLTLAALQECLGADALFWLDAETGLSDVEGSAGLAPQWCRDFTAWLLRDASGPRRQLLRSFLDPAARTHESLAMQRGPGADAALSRVLAGRP